MTNIHFLPRTPEAEPVDDHLCRVDPEPVDRWNIAGTAPLALLALAVLLGGCAVGAWLGVR